MTMDKANFCIAGFNSDSVSPFEDSPTDYGLDLTGTRTDGFGTGSRRPTGMDDLGVTVVGDGLRGSTTARGKDTQLGTDLNQCESEHSSEVISVEPIAREAGGISAQKG